MKCEICKSNLVNLYYREGAGGKKWLKVSGNWYCKECGCVRWRYL